MGPIITIFCMLRHADIVFASFGLPQRNLKRNMCLALLSRGFSSQRGIYKWGYVGIRCSALCNESSK